MPSRRIPFAVHLSYLFIALLVGFAAITNTFQFSETRRLILDEVAQRYVLIGQHAVNDLEHTYRAAGLGSALLAKQRLMAAGSLAQRLDSLPWMTTALRAQPNANTLYMGYENGDFFLLRHWRDDPVLQQRFNAPAGTAWMPAYTACAR